MRSSTPMEGNPWSRDMTITIDDDSHHILELLWVREAWDLHPVGDPPPPLLDTPSSAGTVSDASEWELAWSELWHAVILHAAGAVDPARLDALGNTADGSPERAELLSALIGPNWRDRFGDAAFDDSYLEWEERRFQESIARRPRSLGETPERRSLDALIGAWQAGLSKVITIPCHGDHTRTVGDSALLMTEATRADPLRYAAALGTFRRGKLG